MLKYRERTDQSASTAEADPGAGDMPAYMSLADQYGLGDEMDIGTVTSRQTIEQEYQAYITAQLSARSFDILKFWEVSSDVSES